MNVEIVKITPGFAAILLAKNTGNRPVSKPTVLMYVSMMRAGKWKLNGDAIRIAEDGHILDGQHRLLACTKSNVSFETLIIRGLPNDVFDTIDSGHLRTAGDLLSVDGSSENPKRVAQALKYVEGILSGSSTPFNYPTDMYGINRTAGRTRWRDMVLEAHKNHPEVRLFVRRAKYVGTRLINENSAVALLYLFSKVDVAAADEFYRKLETPTDLQDGSPVLAIRRRLEECRMKHGVTLDPNHAIAWMIIAFNAFRVGRPLKLIRYNSDYAYPRIDGLKYRGQ